MAFSTQKDFFNVPFMNESYELGCKKACVKLKSYESTEDSRAWASDETKKSKFLSDLVKCEYPIGEGEGDFTNADRQVALTGSLIRSTVDASIPSSANTSIGIEKRRFRNSYDGSKDKEILGSEVEIMTGGDSLLQCANVHLAEYRKLLKINTTLETQLEISNEKLKTANQKNRKILEVFDNKLDTNTAKDFYNKIQKFAATGKFNTDEKNEMLQIYQKMKNMDKSYEILQAENNYLKRLIEKLTTRVELKDIPIQEEQSQDISYLQRELNTLRKECLLLRQIEEDYQRSKQQQPKTLPSISQQDVENIKVIIKERNSLREKCKSFKALAQHVEQLQHETQEAKQEANHLNSSLNNKTQYIDTIAAEMQNMQEYYEKRLRNSNLREESLKAQLENLKDEFVHAKCEAQKAHMLVMEASCLRNELLKRDIALNEYDCQYKQLIDVVNELKSVKLQCLYDNQTQTCEEQTDEVTFYTSATLKEILKELKRRGYLDDKIVYGPEPILGPINQNENEAHCCAEMERLQQEIDEMKKRMREEANCEEICKDALERLEELKAQNSQLLHENRDLNSKLIEAEGKLGDMLQKLEKLNEAINKNEQEATIIAKDLEENIALVKDISDVQLRNQQLANAVSAINSRDDQKIIDDLRRQLEAELAKLSKCQQDNVHLLEEVKQREAGLKELKEHNNKLMVENNKLKNNFNSAPSENDTRKDDKTDEAKYKEIPAVVEYSADGESPETDNNLNQYATKVGDKQPSSLTKTTDRKNEEYENKKQTIPNIQELNTPPSSKQRPISIDPQKINDITNSTSTTSKEAIRNKQKLTHQNTKYVDHIKTYIPKVVIPPVEHTSSSKIEKIQLRRDQRQDLALDDFVNKKSDSLKLNLQSGLSFEKEFRKILEEFILECSTYFCRLFNAKSKLYIICHKLCHNGIDVLNFQELAYIHKKIYNQADKLLPGCILDMILTEHREQVETILSSVVMPRLMQGKKFSLKTSDVNICDDDQKCCCCRNELCCNNSEEMLKDKVSKLEKDIGIAREYLETLKSIPLEDSLSTDNDNSTDTNNSTYRGSSPISKQQKLSYANHAKKLKGRTKK